METKRYAGVIVKCEKELLLCKRNTHGSFPGMWSIPGGKIEDGEASKDAAIREFHEETDIDISNEILEFVGVVSFKKKLNDDLKSMMYVYLLQSKQKLIPDFEKAQDGYEHTGWIYVDIDTIRNYKISSRLLALLEKILQKF